jgi:hypothetical protein
MVIHFYPDLPEVMAGEQAVAEHQVLYRLSYRNLHPGRASNPRLPACQEKYP